MSVNKTIKVQGVTTYYILKVNSSGGNFFYSWLAPSGQTPASFYLAPNLAVRFGIIPILSGVPSYLIRVWPGGQGHHVVHTGLL